MPTDTAPTAQKPADDATAVLDELRTNLATMEHRFAANAVRYDEAGMDLAALGQRARLNLVRDLREWIGS